MDLSSPGGASVNDGINPDEFTLHNTTVDQFIRMVSQFGQGLSPGYEMAQQDSRRLSPSIPSPFRPLHF